MTKGRKLSERENQDSHFLKKNYVNILKMECLVRYGADERN